MSGGGGRGRVGGGLDSFMGPSKRAEVLVRFVETLQGKVYYEAKP